MTQATNFINVWPEDAATEPSHSWRTGVPCAVCDNEVITSAGTGPLPRLCVDCENGDFKADFDRERERVKKARQRARARGVAEEDLPDLPVLPELNEAIGDGAWVPQGPHMLIGLRKHLHLSDDQKVVITEDKPKYVNPLGLRPRGLWENDGWLVQMRGYDVPETGRTLGMGVDADERYRKSIVADQTRDHLWLARREIDSLVARGRKAMDRLWTTGVRVPIGPGVEDTPLARTALEARGTYEPSRNAPVSDAEALWLYVDYMYDIAEQEGVAPEPVYDEDGYRLRWDHAAAYRLAEERQMAAGLMPDAYAHSKGARNNAPMYRPERVTAGPPAPVTVEPLLDVAAYRVDADGNPLKPADDAEMERWLASGGYLGPEDTDE